MSGKQRSHSSKAVYYPFADYLKGVLILFVILGHLIPGEPSWIYYFHMPLFLAISGYLMTEKRLKTTALPELVRRSWHRMLIPWAVASIVYSGGALGLHLMKGTLTFETVWMRVIYPHGHLWFIPALFGMMVLAFVLLRLRLPHWVVLAAAVLFALAWKVLWHDLSPWGGPAALKWFGDKRVLTLFVFFYAGYYLRNVPGACFGPAGFLILVVLAAIGLRVFGHEKAFNPWLTTGNWMILNLALAGLCAAGMSLRNLPAQEALQWIGVRSLPIYLWHQFPITLLGTYLKLDVSHPVLYYALSLALIGLLMAALPRLALNSAAQVLLFGVRK